MNGRALKNVTFRQWWALGVSAAVCAAVIAMTRYVRPVQFVGDRELAGLVNERAALAGNTDRIRDELRAQVSAIPPKHTTPAVIAGVTAKLGPTWRWEERNGKATLNRVRPRLRDWPVLVSTIEMLEAQPGVTLTGLEIGTTGTHTRRALAHVAVEISCRP